MAVKSAVEVMYKNVPTWPKRHDELVNKFEEQLPNPFVAASKGYLDDVLEHYESTDRIIGDLHLLRHKKMHVQGTSNKKDANFPLQLKKLILLCCTPSMHVACNLFQKKVPFQSTITFLSRG